MDYLNSIFLAKYKKIFPGAFMDIIPYIKIIDMDELLNFKPTNVKK
jgi:hypothetical protein